MSLKNCKVIIVDDHKLFRDGFKLALKLIKNVELVGEAANGEELLQLLETTKPDIVFIDVKMPVMNGQQAVVKTSQDHPDIKFIVLTSLGEYASIKKMILAGVEGYMLKNAEIDEIKTAIERVVSGKNYFSNDVLYQITRNTASESGKDGLKPENVDLSDREKEVLAMLCEGQSVMEISEELHISYRTVEKHKEKLMAKSQTKNTVNLILWALKNRFVEI